MVSWFLFSSTPLNSTINLVRYKHFDGAGKPHQIGVTFPSFIISFIPKESFYHVKIFIRNNKQKQAIYESQNSCFFDNYFIRLYPLNPFIPSLPLLSCYQLRNTYWDSFRQLDSWRLAIMGFRLIYSPKQSYDSQHLLHFHKFFKRTKPQPYSLRFNVKWSY